MDQKSFCVLLVGDVAVDFFHDAEAGAVRSDLPFLFTRESAYCPAISKVQQKTYDAVLVAEAFDRHSGLEFIHHARLVDADIPIIFLVSAYDDALDFKARKIGATDCVVEKALDLAVLQNILAQKGHLSQRNKGQDKQNGVLKMIEGFLFS